MNKKIIFPVVVLAILLVPTISVGATQNANTNKDGVYYGIYARAGKIILVIDNYRNESLNYSFFVAYSIFRGIIGIILKNRLPTIISENGTINASSALEKTYGVRFSFSPIIAQLKLDNTTVLVCIGFVFGKRVIFRTTVGRSGT